MASSSTTTTEALPTVLPLIYPLDDFYAQDKMILPGVKTISGDKMPEPYRTLLVHRNDMTPTLENFHKQTIHIKLIREQRRGNFYFREVVLTLDGSGEYVEFGAIKIDLDLLKPEVKRLVLEAKLPLGHILNKFRVPHSCNPKAFLEIGCDHFIQESLGLKDTPLLYGRRNTLFDSRQQILAEVVEILPEIKDQTPSAG